MEFLKNSPPPDAGTGFIIDENNLTRAAVNNAAGVVTRWRQMAGWCTPTTTATFPPKIFYARRKKNVDSRYVTSFKRLLCRKMLQNLFICYVILGSLRSVMLMTRIAAVVKIRFAW
jgi:hypothetical protein